MSFCVFRFHSTRFFSSACTHIFSCCCLLFVAFIECTAFHCALVYFNSLLIQNDRMNVGFVIMLTLAFSSSNILLYFLFFFYSISMHTVREKNSISRLYLVPLHSRLSVCMFLYSRCIFFLFLFVLMRFFLKLLFLLVFFFSILLCSFVPIHRKIEEK